MNLEKIYIDTSTEPKYKFISEEIKEGLIRVQNKNSGQYGYINEQGEEIIPCIYSNAKDFSDGLALVEDRTTKLFITPTGERKLILPSQYFEVRSFHDGLAAIALSMHNWGFIDKEGKKVIPCVYKEVSDFSEGFAIVNDSNLCKDLSGENKEVPPRYCFIDKKGEIQKQFCGHYKITMDSIFHNGLAPVNAFYKAMEAIENNFSHLAFVTPEGCLYTEEKKVQELEKKYKKEQEEEKKEISKKLQQEILIYYATIRILDRKIKITASSTLELKQKEKETLLELEKTIEQFSKDVSFYKEIVEEEIKNLTLK